MDIEDGGVGLSRLVRRIDLLVGSKKWRQVNEDGIYDNSGDDVGYSDLFLRSCLKWECSSPNTQFDYSLL